VCREVILHVTETGYEFDLIGFSLDALSGCLVLGKDWRMLEVDAEKAKETIASCMALSVPLYPEDDAAASALESLVQSLYDDGFRKEAEDGKETRIKFKGARGVTYDSDSGTWDIRPTESVFPADALIAAARSNIDADEVKEARTVLRRLRQGISELGRLLETDTRNEHDLQRCLTSHPVLFGLEYKRIIPKYELGSDYELDYALERTSGLVDLVEIEASTLPPYTQAGNPTAHLVHAEQQVLDWLEWLESNARIARDDLPQMMRPQGQVVIGRSNELREGDRRRLQRRNAAFQGSLQILTYDDLLSRAKTMLAILSPPEV